MEKIKKEVADKEKEKYDGQLKAKEDELNQQKEALKKQEEEMDGLRVEMENLNKSINDCSQSDDAKKRELEDKLKVQQDKLTAKEEETKALKSQVDTLTEERDTAQTKLNEANDASATAEANVTEAEIQQDDIENPTKIPQVNLLNDKKNDEGDEEEEIDVSGYFDSVSGEKEKGVIKAPMADDGEVIIYLKRRPSDGKFVVSTLGTGGESDNTNVWISNIGHAPEAVAGDKIEVHSGGV